MVTVVTFLDGWRVCLIRWLHYIPHTMYDVLAFFDDKADCLGWWLMWLQIWWIPCLPRSMDTALASNEVWRPCSMVILLVWNDGWCAYLVRCITCLPRAMDTALASHDVWRPCLDRWLFCLSRTVVSMLTLDQGMMINYIRQYGLWWSDWRFWGAWIHFTIAVVPRCRLTRGW